MFDSYYVTFDCKLYNLSVFLLLLMGPNDVPMLYVTEYSRINFVIRNNIINVAQDLCFWGEKHW
jgi:hypothetical protein